MLIYWSLFFIVMLIQFFPVKSEKQYVKKLVISFSLIFLYGAFRDNYGLDYDVYKEFYESIKLNNVYQDEHMEFGYFVLNKILPSFRFVLIFQALLLFTAYYYLFKWYIPYKWSWLAFVVLFMAGNFTIFFMLSGIRNGIAISIFILTLPFIIKRKIVPFVILIYLAYFFHQSIVLFAPIGYLVANNKAISKTEVSVWISVVLFFLITSFTSLIEFVDLFIITYFERYSVYTSQIDEIQSVGILMNLFVITMVIITLLFLIKTKISPTENSIMRLTLLFLISGILGVLNVRMTQVFIPFILPGFIIVVNRSKVLWIKNTFVVFTLLYFSYSFWQWMISPKFSYQDYESILF